MQLTKMYSDKDIKTILLNETNFIKRLFSQTKFPNVSNENEQIDVTVSSKDSIPEPANKAPRAKSITELQNRLQKIQKKETLTFKDKLQRRELKKRMKKKDKQIERKGNQVKGVMLKREEKSTDDTKTSNANESKVIFNKDNKIVYSKFKFPEEKKKKKGADAKPEIMLEKIKKQKEKLTNLESSGEVEKAAEIKEKTAWKSALAKAEGQKVKDDPVLLKKTIDRKKQKKVSSKKKWDARKEAVKKAQEEKQAKRTKNIEQRKKEKKVKKMKQAVKKGKVIPGL